MESEKADFKIAFDGTWFHDGAPIKREALAKLFSDRALKRDEQGDYWLQTPFEKYPVDVEDVPYVITDYKEKNGLFIFTSNMEEDIACDSDHPLQLKECRKLNQKLPYIEVRDGLMARLSRPVYYHLIEKYGASITSSGQTYPLGETDA